LNISFKYQNNWRGFLALIVVAFSLQTSLFGQKYQQTIDSLKALVEIQTDTLLLATLVELDAYIASKEPEEALRYLNIGYDTARELGHLYYEAEMLNLMGAAHYYLAQYDKAGSHWLNSLEVVKQIDEQTYAAEPRIMLLHSTLLMNMGVINKLRGDNTEALNYYQQSLELRKKIGSEIGIAVGYVNIGNLYSTAGNDEKALEYLLKAEAIYNEQENVFGQGSVLNNIALIYQRKNDLTQAKAYFERSLEKYKSIDNVKQVALLYTNLGQLYRNENNFDEALDYFALSLIMKKEIGDKLGIGQNYQYMADAYFHSGSPDRAIEYYLKALEIIEELQVAKNLLGCYKGIASAYAASGNFERAYFYMNRFSELNAEIQSENISKQLAEQEARFANAEKEKQLEIKDLELEAKTALIKQRQIQLWVLVAGFLLMVSIAIIFIQRFRIESRFHRQLEVQNAELRQTYEELKTTLISKEEKEALIKEIHHRVKNNLQIISSLISIQANSIEDRKAERMLREVQNRVLSMAMLHEQLYRAPDMAQIDVENYIDQLLENLMQIYSSDKSIRFNVEISAENFSVDTLIPIGLLVNEVVTNSLKYAFRGRDTGSVSVRIYPHDAGRYCMIIEDDGIGISHDAKHETTGSVGMELIETFIAQLDGECKIMASQGTRYEILFHPILRKETSLLKKSGMPTA
jgi:two-component sensor histidine kinase